MQSLVLSGMEGSSLYSVALTATLAALGYATYFVTSASVDIEIPSETPDAIELAQDTVVSNGVYSLTFSAATGRMTTIEVLATGLTMPITQVCVYVYVCVYVCICV